MSTRSTPTPTAPTTALPSLAALNVARTDLTADGEELPPVPAPLPPPRGGGASGRINAGGPLPFRQCIDPFWLGKNLDLVRSAPFQEDKVFLWGRWQPKPQAPVWFYREHHGSATRIVGAGTEARRVAATNDQLFTWQQAAYGRTAPNQRKNPMAGVLGKVLDAPILPPDEPDVNTPITIGEFCFTRNKKLHIVDGGNVFYVKPDPGTAYPDQNAMFAYDNPRRFFTGLTPHAQKQVDLVGGSAGPQGQAALRQATSDVLPVVVMKRESFFRAFSKNQFVPHADPGEWVPAHAAYDVLGPLLRNGPTGPREGTLGTPIVCVVLHTSSADAELVADSVKLPDEMGNEKKKCGLIPQALYTDPVSPDPIHREWQKWALANGFYTHAKCEVDDFLATILNDQLKGPDAHAENRWLPEVYRSIAKMRRRGYNSMPGQRIVSDDRSVDKLRLQWNPRDENARLARDSSTDQVTAALKMAAETERVSLDSFLSQFPEASVDIYVANHRHGGPPAAAVATQTNDGRYDPETPEQAQARRRAREAEREAKEAEEAEEAAKKAQEAKEEAKKAKEKQELPLIDRPSPSSFGAIKEREEAARKEAARKEEERKEAERKEEERMEKERNFRSTMPRGEGGRRVLNLLPRTATTPKPAPPAGDSVEQAELRRALEASKLEAPAPTPKKSNSDDDEEDEEDMLNAMVQARRKRDKEKK